MLAFQDYHVWSCTSCQYLLCGGYASASLRYFFTKLGAVTSCSGGLRGTFPGRGWHEPEIGVLSGDVFLSGVLWLALVANNYR